MSGHLSHPKYRADIDGLRAIAVVAVVAFHAFPEWVTGGFIGVDVFFVISGFLISTIIFENLEKDTFSFREFYARRIRRIFPTLLTVLIAVYAVGWFTLFSSEYRQLGKHIFGGSFFISNFLFLREHGYFDVNSDSKPLIHLWSLGIEEQFYIAWPLLAWFLFKAKWKILPIIFMLGMASLCYNIYIIEEHTVSSFYSPQTRFWELLIGAWLAYKKNTRKVPNLSNFIRDNEKAFLGFLLISLAVILITKDDYFPSWLALFPTIGTALVISSGTKAWFNQAVLSNKILVWFGLISYPLYLWHWPLLSFARIIAGETPPSWVRILLVLISIFLAWLTYKFIEKPIRFGNNLRIKTIYLLMAMMFLGSIGGVTYLKNGFNFRKIVKENEFNNKQLQWNKFKSKECIKHVGFNPMFCNIFGNINNMKVAVIGDSMANAIAPGLAKIYADEQYGLINLGLSSCPPINGVGSTKFSGELTCQEAVEKTYDFILRNDSIKIVIMALSAKYLKYWDIPNANLQDTDSQKFDKLKPYINKNIIELNNYGKRVIITFDIPEFPRSPSDCLDRTIFSLTKKNCTFDEDELKYRHPYIDLYQNFLESRSDVCIFYQLPIFKENNKFKLMDNHNQLLMRDRMHLSYYGSEQMGLLFKKSKCYSEDYKK